MKSVSLVVVLHVILNYIKIMSPTRHCYYFKIYVAANNANYTYQFFKEIIY
jgi:hypothetical protein